MLSNALDALAGACLTFGAYAFGGRGAAAFVAGFVLLAISYQQSEPDRPSVTRIRFVRDEPAAAPRRVREPMITNETLARDIQGRAGQEG